MSDGPATEPPTSSGSEEPEERPSSAPPSPPTVSPDEPVTASGSGPSVRGRAPSGPPSTRIRNLAVGALVGLTIAGWTGDLLLSTLIDTHPLLFITLNARNRNLVLASPFLDAKSFYTVALIRLLLSDPLFFMFGRWYGDAAVRWMERKAPTYGQLMRSAEKWFNKAAYPMVALAPNNFICLFAGSSGMNPFAFAVLNVGGTLGRLWALRRFGDVFSSPLGRVTDFITDYRLPVFLVSLALVGFSVWSERRAGGTDMKALDQIEREASDDD